MSIFFRKLILLTGMMLFILNVKAKVDYSPAFQDSFVVNNAQSNEIEAVLSQSNGTLVSELSKWDVQQVRQTTPFYYESFILLVIVFAILLIKILYPSYIKDNFLSISKYKNFISLYHSKKYTDLLPITILFILRNIVFSVVVIYMADVFRGSFEFSDFKTFTQVFVVISLSYLLVYLFEFLTQAILGFGEYFKSYITQLIIITTWGWLLASSIAVVFNLNLFLLPIKSAVYVFGLLIAITSFFAIYRSYKIGNEAKDANLISFILYICTFKIIPYLLIFKYLDVNGLMVW